MTSAQPCHVCAGAARTVLYHQNFSGLSNGSFLHSYDVCVCNVCGFGFAGGLPPVEDFDRCYEEMSKCDYLESNGVESEQHLSRFESVAAYLINLAMPRAEFIVAKTGNIGAHPEVQFKAHLLLRQA